MSIGEHIRKYRKAAGLTQVELAQKLGLRQYVITNYERGIRKPPTDTLPRIAKALGVGLEELYGLKESSRPEKTHIHRSSREHQAQEVFRKLSPEEQRLILKQMRMLAGMKEK